MAGQSARAHAAFDVPQSHRGVEGSGGEVQARVRMVGHRPGRTPFDRVDLFGVTSKVVHALGHVHRPQLERHVIGAGGQQFALRVPLDSIHFILYKIGRD